MYKLDLNGQWNFGENGKDSLYPAKIPGCVHLDLQENNLIDDPFWRDQEKELDWIGKRDWIYQREFDMPDEVMNLENLILQCDGLDTLAEIEINGIYISSSNNMHRTWEFPVRHALKSGTNRIKIIFRSAVSECERRQEKLSLGANKYSPLSPDGKSHLRKDISNFGWDWGPCLVTCGIWRGIRILGWDTVRFTGVRFAQEHGNNKVNLEVRPETEGMSNDHYCVVELKKGEYKEEHQVELGKSTRFEIISPELWWPNGMGDHPLYDVQVKLCHNSGKVLEQKTKKIGLRRIELIRENDSWGESFAFAINGITFFAKGANWIPPSSFAPEVDAEWRRDLLTSARDANMNMIRIWGGGVYEADDFYDSCDALGLLVWQDFMFACAAYPSDEEFLNNLRGELEDNIKRIRHHACLALWCGNNEIDVRIYKLKDWPEFPPEEYEKIFDQFIPEVVNQLSTDIDYWPCSPHSPVGPREDVNNQDCGDTHLWSVWHKLEPFEWFRTSYPRFCSEFGFQSFPELETVKTFTAPEDRYINSRIMDYHQRSRIGNSIFLQYLNWLPLPANFESTLLATQILQGIALKYAIEQWRRNMPRCMGALYWQLNDCWPGPSWSTIDYKLNWKASQYIVKRAFAPIMLSIVENQADTDFEVHVSSDKLEDVNGKLFWYITDSTGEDLLHGESDCLIPSRKSIPIQKIPVDISSLDTSAHELICWCELEVDGIIISRNTASLVKPKHINLKKPNFVYKVDGNNGLFKVKISSDVNALWVFIDIGTVGHRCSDNFFDMRQGAEYEIEVFTGSDILKEELLKMIKVKSILDLV